MTDDSGALTRHQVYEQIRASEKARGASEDEAARIAAERVDAVMEIKKAE